MDDQPPNGNASPLLTQIFQLWVVPDLERRGLDPAETPVEAALVVMAPGRPVQTLINEEVSLVAKVPRELVQEANPGHLAVTADAVKHLRPDSIDPNAGWICFVSFGEEVVISFDFRRNRERAQRCVERAREFLASARLAVEADLIGPSVDDALASAELCVTAQMLAFAFERQSPELRDHQVKRRWFRDWAETGNAPGDYSRALARLAAVRRSARYAEGRLPRAGEVRGLIDVVEAMVEHAGDQVGDRPLTGDEQGDGST